MLPVEVKNKKKIKVGCCGFPVAQALYFDKFEVIEIQQTFYEIPPLLTAAKWKAEAPRGFEFTMKAWQLITHEPTSPTYKKMKMRIEEKDKGKLGFFKPTDQVFQAWERTKEFAERLGARVILFQTPPRFAPSSENRENLHRFFTKIKRDGMTLLWEPRGEWKEKEIEEVCKEFDLIDVVDPFKRKPAYGRLYYFRLHGITGYQYQYTMKDFKKLSDLCQKKNESYIFFNNMSMMQDSQKLISLLR